MHFTTMKTCEVVIPYLSCQISEKHVGKDEGRGLSVLPWPAAFRPLAPEFLLATSTCHFLAPVTALRRAAMERERATACGCRPAPSTFACSFSPYSLYSQYSWHTAPHQTPPSAGQPELTQDQHPSGMPGSPAQLSVGQSP